MSQSASIDPGGPPAPLGAGIGTVKSQLQAEQRWLTLMRLAFGLACCSWLLLIGWALPWTPLLGQLSTDPDAAAVLGLIFALMAVAWTFAFRLVWWPAFRNESLRDFVRVLFGAQLLIRGPKQFESRLAKECRLARRGRAEPFSLIVVDLPKASANRRSHAPRGRTEPSLAALLVRSIARADDLVGDGAPSRVWLLAAAADETVRERVVERVAGALRNAPFIGPAEGCRVGASTFGPDGKRATELLSAAEARMTPLASPAGAHQAA